MDRCACLEQAISARLSNGIPSGFTGFGAVIYQGDFNVFPTTPLIEESALVPSIIDDSEIASLLISLSQYSDYRHDGFHFIHHQMGLTFLSIFISPAIPIGYEPKHFNVGARYRSAELISRMDNIGGVLIVEKSGRINKIINGQLV